MRGKAVLWARDEVLVGSSDGWPAAEDPLNPPTVRVADVPFPGDVIAAGRPICSLYAAGPTAAECLDRLRAIAARVERDLSPLPTDAVHAAGAERGRAADA